MYDPLRAKTKVVFYSTVAFLFGLGLASGMGWTRSSNAMPVVSETPQVSAAAVRPAADLSEAFVNLASAVTPAVVRIEAKRPAPANHPEIPDAFKRFFDIPEGNRGAPPQGELAGGSGFIVSKDGYILTNNHVVEDADEVRVYLQDRRYFDATIVGTDPFTDVAVIKIDVGEPLPVMSFGNSDDVKVGEWVLAIGNPGFGASTQLDYTVTAGIVSARGRLLGLLNNDLRRTPGVDPNLAGYSIEDFIQTDAAINPGNSGGPMVDLHGQVIGINSAIASTTGYYQGYGFAIPINLARRVMKDLIEYGHVQRPMIGVQITKVWPEDAEYYGLPSVSGVLVQGVTKGGPADGKLKPEDVIVAIDGRSVGYMAQLQSRIAEHHPGDRVTLTIYRNKKKMKVTIKLGEAPINEVAAKPVERTVHAAERLGINVEYVPEDQGKEMGFGRAGVVITDVAGASPAQRRGVPRGTMLTRINDVEIHSTEDVRRVLDSIEGGQIVSLHLLDRTGATQVINVRMPRK